MSASEFRKVSTKQQRIAELAEQSPEMVFTSIAYNISLKSNRSILKSIDTAAFQGLVDSAPKIKWTKNR